MATRNTTATSTARPGRARTNPTRAARRSDSTPPTSRQRGGGGGRAPRSDDGGREQDRKQVGSRQPQPQPRGGRVVESLRSAGSTLGGGISAHPLPAALIGAGLAWLLLESRGGSGSGGGGGGRRSAMMERARSRFEEVSEDVSEAVESALGSAKDAVTSGTRTVRDGLSMAADSVKGGALRVGEYTQQGVRAVGEGGRRGYEHTRDAAAQTWQQHPLASGLAVLAAGVAIGMMMPGTGRENAVLGRQADGVKRRIKSAGSRLAERGQRVASAVGDALRQEAEGEGFGPGEVVRKVRRIAGRVKEAAATAARRERLDPVGVLSEPNGGSAGDDAGARPGAGGGGNSPSKRRRNRGK